MGVNMNDTYGLGQEIGELITCYCRKNNISYDAFFTAISNTPSMFISGIGDGIGGHRNDGRSMHNGTLESYKLP